MFGGNDGTVTCNDGGGALSRVEAKQRVMKVVVGLGGKTTRLGWVE